MPQRETTTPIDLLDAHGELSVAGWSRHPSIRFDRERVRHGRERLRRWDFLTIADARLSLSVTLADLSFGGFVAIETLSFPACRHRVHLRPFRDPSRLSLSEHAGEAFAYRDPDGSHVVATREGDELTLAFALRPWWGAARVEGSVALRWPRTHESLTSAMAFPHEPGGFFLETKAPGIPCRGEVRFGGATHVFAERDTFAVMDWGRGVWPRDVFWRWGSFSARTDRGIVGLNLGHGFGDTSAATEDLFVLDGIAHKLGEVHWQLDRSDYLAPWRMRSRDGRVTLAFTPVHDQHSALPVPGKSFRAHRVFGHYEGTLVTDAGLSVRVPPSLGFAEEVWIRW